MLQSIVFEYRPDSYAALERTVLEAIDDGAPQVVLNLDSLGTLDNVAIRGLIRLLRRVRAVGRTLALQTSKPDILRTLSVTALDRVFEMTLTLRST